MDKFIIRIQINYTFFLLDKLGSLFDIGSQHAMMHVVKIAPLLPCVSVWN